MFFGTLFGISVGKLLVNYQIGDWKVWVCGGLPGLSLAWLSQRKKSRKKRLSSTDNP